MFVFELFLNVGTKVSVIFDPSPLNKNENGLSFLFPGKNTGRQCSGYENK